MPFSLKFTCWSLNPNVMVGEGGAFGRWLCPNGGALLCGISVLISRNMGELPPSLSLSLSRLSTLWGYKEKAAVWKPGWVLSSDTGSLIFEIPSLQTVRKTHCLHHPSMVFCYSSLSWLRHRHILYLPRSAQPYLFLDLLMLCPASVSTVGGHCSAPEIDQPAPHTGSLAAPWQWETKGGQSAQINFPSPKAGLISNQAAQRTLHIQGFTMAGAETCHLAWLPMPACLAVRHYSINIKPCHGLFSYEIWLRWGEIDLWTKLKNHLLFWEVWYKGRGKWVNELYRSDDEREAMMWRPHSVGKS